MAEVVIDENELNTLMAARKLLEQLNSDPETRGHLGKAIKKHYPNTRTEEDIAAEVAKPYLEQVEATASKMKEMMAKLEERDAKDMEARTMADLSSKFDRLKSSYGYNDDGIDKIKALMVDRNIPDPDAAAALFERLNPTPVETRSSWEPDSWNLKEDAVDRDVQGLFADPDRWADKEVGKVLAEFRSQDSQG